MTNAKDNVGDIFIADEQLRRSADVVFGVDLLGSSLDEPSYYVRLADMVQAFVRDRMSPDGRKTETESMRECLLLAASLEIEAARIRAIISGVDHCP